MATRNTLSVDGDETPSGDDAGPDQDEAAPTDAPKSKRLKKGYKDPTDTLARGKFKTPRGNIREDF